MLRRLYSLLWYVVTPLVLIHLWRRSKRLAEYSQHWGERFGYYAVKPAKPVIWIHTVSVGETRAAAPLVRALISRYPNYQILLTGMTPTGRETAHQLFGEDVLRTYLPYDQPDAVKRFLHHFQPRFGVILETELWPNLIHFCHRNRIPLFMVNARLSNKSLMGYMKVRALVGPALGKLTAIAAQGEEGAQRLRQLAGKYAPPIVVTGNLKFEFNPSQKLMAQGRDWRRILGSQLIWVAASTREGEESRILAELACSPWAAHALLILVPRHPQRFDEVAELLAQHCLQFIRRSEWDGQSALPPGTHVLLGDSMGEMTAWFSTADVAFVGGSLLDFGCHNVIEPCALGCPVVFGPSTFNFPEACAEALEAGAARQVKDAGDLIETVSRLLDDRSMRSEMCIAGQAMVAKHRGAVDKVLAILPRPE